MQQSELMKLTPRVPTTEENVAQSLVLRELYVCEEGPLLRYAFSLTGRRAVAEEIVQEVFLELHKRFTEVEAPRAWLFRSVRNRAYNHVRDHKRELLQHDQVESDSSSGEQSPEALMMRMESIGKLRLLMQELNEADRELVMLKYFQNFKYREISERTGLSVSNVGYRLHHILKELKSKLDPQVVGEEL